MVGILGGPATLLPRSQCGRYTDEVLLPSMVGLSAQSLGTFQGSVKTASPTLPGSLILTPFPGFYGL